ncbi:MAG: 50S ribosomal protein L32 [Candidatus Marinimicrobia bacterium]|nr:50S ribosomal protein L32 [Candidatus Neomarinimicrobiota bacterium]
MALPKRRISLSNKRKRRTHWKLTPTNSTKCANCGEQKLPHRACPSCGYYKGRQVIEAKEA